MASLKQDLDEYLLLQSDQKKNFSAKIPQIKVPDLGKLFTRSEPTEPSNSWLQDTQDSCCPKLSRLQRIVGFVACLGLGALCFSISVFYIPVLILKARKFALLYSLGSMFFILGFCFLSGFGAFLKTAFSKPRMLVSGTYTSSLIATLYCALLVHSTALTVLFAVAQIIALLFMIVGTVPGGASGIKLFGKMFKSTVSSTSTLPV
ncbi:vesicle transport protein SFT2C [Bactrocera oleae]|uniref:vesicle transport protein SFT2C n=1 Tax=Bactrocera oleae TaxID=104688 RepID=UPI0006B73A19|nr:vesicle transport protein SFT2C isoform X1 [Bactrocera oleae]